MNDGVASGDGGVDLVNERTGVERAVQGLARVKSLNNKLRSRDDFKRRLVD